jgi:hypothetical protein
MLTSGTCPTVARIKNPQQVTIDPNPPKDWDGKSRALAPFEKPWKTAHEGLQERNVGNTNHESLGKQQL